MALVVTIAGVNRTSVIETDTIRINQVADSFTFTATLSLFDEDGDIDITAGSHLDADEITMVDGGTNYFGGYIVNQDIEAAEEDSRHLHLQCQGFGIRLNETLIAIEDYSNKADDWIINDLFDTYLAAFDSVTHVAQIDASMDIPFTEMTLAECMEAICARTKGRWYIDNDKKVHYFAAEANEVAWFLSDTPEAATENLVTNPSFEIDTAGWAAWNAGIIARSGENAPFGDYSLKVTGDGVAPRGATTTAITVVAETVYTASMYAAIEAGTPNFRVWDNSNSDWIGEVILPTGGPVVRYENNFTTPVGCTAVLIVFYGVDAWQGYFDGVQLEQKVAATSYCDGTRAGCDWSGTAHASTSDRIISYSYHAKPEKKIDAAAIVNRVRVIGADDFAVNRNDATSQAAYGIRAGIVTDQSLETTAAMEERGDDVLDKNKDPRTTYVVSTFQDGAVAGMDVGFRCPQLDIDTEQVIRELNITWWMNEPSYELTLGTHAETSAISRAFYTGSTIRKVIIDPNIPMGSRGWGHDIPFAATDYRTVKWVDGGTITLAGGVGSFAIAANAGNSTGNMAAITYIYFDADVSLTELQDDVDPANAIGANKILVAVAGPVADEDTNKAIFQVFGGAGTGVLIVADNVAADTITGNEIAANAIVAGHIEAAAIETDKIKAGAVVADKLSIGQTLFSNADGLLILNPPIQIEKVIADNSWHTLRGQKAALGGALHLKQGRWPGTKAVVVEKAVTNLITNPSIEIDTTGWVAHLSTNTKNTAHRVFGDAALKCVTNNVGAVEGTYMITTAFTAAATEYTFSTYLRGSGTVYLRFWDAVGGNQYSPAITLTDTWKSYELTATFGAGAARNVGVFTQAQQAITFYCDGFQLAVYATTYCDGSLGDGYAWTDGDHASSSTRAATEINLDAHVGLVASNDTLSFRAVAQMPYDADATWPQDSSYLLDVRGADNNNRIILYYYSQGANDEFRVYINGDTRISGNAAQTFKAGDWLDILLTLDFANDEYILSIDNVEIEKDETALAAPTLTEWNIGSDYQGANQGGFVFAEFAAFDRVLTAIEKAQLYNLQRPLVDTGATDQPGIYILDGKFRIQSSQTGIRIEITADQIAGFDGAGTKQFYLQASDGKAYAGGGAVVLDEYGVTFDGHESMLWFTDDALNDFALGLIAADGFTISEYVAAAQKGLFRIRWNTGDIRLDLDYNDLADTVTIYSYAPLTISTGGASDITIEPGSDRLLLRSTYLELWELAADPVAPAADRARFYTREGAPGKTQLVIRFPTGAIQVIATEP